MMRWRASANEIVNQTLIAPWMVGRSTCCIGDVAVVLSVWRTIFSQLPHFAHSLASFPIAQFICELFTPEPCHMHEFVYRLMHAACAAGQTSTCVWKYPFATRILNQFKYKSFCCLFDRISSSFFIVFFYWRHTHMVTCLLIPSHLSSHSLFVLSCFSVIYTDSPICRNTVEHFLLRVVAHKRRSECDVRDACETNLTKNEPK